MLDRRVKTLYTPRLIITLLYSYSFEHVGMYLMYINKVLRIVLSSYNNQHS